mgnify:FL=1
MNVLLNENVHGPSHLKTSLVFSAEISNRQISNGQCRDNCNNQQWMIHNPSLSCFYHILSILVILQREYHKIYSADRKRVV